MWQTILDPFNMLFVWQWSMAHTRTHLKLIIPLIPCKHQLLRSSVSIAGFLHQAEENLALLSSRVDGTPRLKLGTTRTQAYLQFFCIGALTCRKFLVLWHNISEVAPGDSEWVKIILSLRRLHPAHSVQVQLFTRSADLTAITSRWLAHLQI